MFPIRPTTRAGQVPLPHSHLPAGQGDKDLTPQPHIWTLPAHRGGLAAPHVLVVPAETKAELSIIRRLASAVAEGTQPSPRATRLWGDSQTLTTSPRSPFSPCHGTEGRG